MEECVSEAIKERGKVEGIGAQDDMVISLAVENAATSTANDNYILLEDLCLVDDAPPSKGTPKRTAIGLNF